jgi:hypothetical protein
MLRRDGWYELDDSYILAISKWTNDRESLATTLKETGWFFSVGEAMRAAESAVLVHAWAGVDPDDGVLVVCDEDGEGGRLLEVTPITLADVSDMME